MEEAKKAKTFGQALLDFWWLFAIVIVLWGVTFLLLIPIGSIDSWGDRGTFGDMFGAVNSLFSGLAFVGLIIAIRLQSQELELQRTELRQTTKELEGQKKQLELQNKAFKIQNFERGFLSC